MTITITEGDRYRVDGGDVYVVERVHLKDETVTLSLEGTDCTHFIMSAKTLFNGIRQGEWNLLPKEPAKETEVRGGKHKCHCPDEYFTYNPVGCQCGGW